MMITLALGSFGPPLTRVMTHVRRAGPLTREELVGRTGLSASTVRRATSALASSGLLTERPDLVPAGTVGRPSFPVEIDSEHFVTLACHVGRRNTTVALGDLRNRILARTELRTSPTDPETDSGTFARDIASRFIGLLSDFPDRVALSAGLVAAWGDVDHDRDELGAALSLKVGLPTETWELVPALAASEYVCRPEDLPGASLYLYCRDTVGFVMALERPAGTDIARAGRLSHYPAGGDAPCRCGRTGCLEGLVSDQAVAEAAVAAGIVTRPDISSVVRAAAQGDAAAHEMLCRRAETLGRVAAILRDMHNPERVVLFGEGFTAYPPGLEVTRASLAAATATPTAIDVSFTRFAGDVQAMAAGTVALQRVYNDPESVLTADPLARCSGAFAHA